jgi:hypothetical protein
MNIIQIMGLIQSLLGTISVVQGVISETMALLHDLQKTGRELTPKEQSWLLSIRVNSETSLANAISEDV